MRRRIFLALPLIALALPARAAETIGIVLMHGKGGTPDKLVFNLGAALERAGYLVERPEMCWSQRRIYDKPYLDCLAEIDAAVATLKRRGATAIVVAGLSLGGNAALGYGARHDRLKGIIAVAPAHFPERAINRAEIRDSLARAEHLIADGKGDEREQFSDVNVGAPISVRATAQAYASFFGTASAAIIPANAAKLTAPLLWLAGSNDPTQLGPDYAFAKAPSNPLNRYVVLPSGHFNAADAAAEPVLAWLKELE
ncbi:MAG: alpha/beta hydrolase [Stellaceae bacterium]